MIVIIYFSYTKAFVQMYYAPDFYFIGYPQPNRYAVGLICFSSKVFSSSLIAILPRRCQQLLIVSKMRP